MPTTTTSIDRPASGSSASVRVTARPRPKRRASGRWLMTCWRRDRDRRSSDRRLSRRRDWRPRAGPAAHTLDASRGRRGRGPAALGEAQPCGKGGRCAAHRRPGRCGQLPEGETGDVAQRIESPRRQVFRRQQAVGAAVQPPGDCLASTGVSTERFLRRQDGDVTLVSRSSSAALGTLSMVSHPENVTQMLRWKCRENEVYSSAAASAASQGRSAARAALPRSPVHGSGVGSSSGRSSSRRDRRAARRDDRERRLAPRVEDPSTSDAFGRGIPGGAGLVGGPLRRYLLCDRV